MPILSWVFDAFFFGDFDIATASLFVAGTNEFVREWARSVFFVFVKLFYLADVHKIIIIYI